MASIRCSTCYVKRTGTRRRTTGADAAVGTETPKSHAVRLSMAAGTRLAKRCAPALGGNRRTCGAGARDRTLTLEKIGGLVQSARPRHLPRRHAVAPLDRRIRAVGHQQSDDLRRGLFVVRKIEQDR